MSVNFFNILFRLRNIKFSRRARSFAIPDDQGTCTAEGQALPAVLVSAEEKISMRKTLIYTALAMLITVSALAEEGTYLYKGRPLKYFTKTERLQTTYLFEQGLPDTPQDVIAAVRHGIRMTYGIDKLATREPVSVDMQGNRMLKFKAKKGFVLVTLARNDKNRVIGFTMVESEK
jgi:hypothetical protein